MNTKEQRETMSAVYSKLANLIPQATTRVDICEPATGYYSATDEWKTTSIDVISARDLATLLEQAAQELLEE